MIIASTPLSHSTDIHNISNNLSVNRFPHFGVVCKFVSLLECVIWWLRGAVKGRAGVQRGLVRKNVGAGRGGGALYVVKRKSM